MDFVGPLLHVLGCSLFVQVSYHVEKLRRIESKSERDWPAVAYDIG